jgi:hypothetical protein
LQKELDEKVDSLRQRQEERKGFLRQINNEEQTRQDHKNWQNIQKELETADKLASNFHHYQAMRQNPLLAIEGERVR